MSFLFRRFVGIIVLVPAGALLLAARGAAVAAASRGLAAGSAVTPNAMGRSCAWAEYRGVAGRLPLYIKCMPRNIMMHRAVIFGRHHVPVVFHGWNSIVQTCINDAVQSASLVN